MMLEAPRPLAARIAETATPVLFAIEEMVSPERIV